MPGPDADDGGRTRVTVFRVGDRHLFRHYFEEDAVFERLQPYYERYEHRFSVPDARIAGVRDFLEGRGYDLVTAEDPDRYAVAVRKYTDHPQVVFDEAVLQVGTEGHNVFVLSDRTAVERAVEQGASPLRELGMTLDLG